MIHTPVEQINEEVLQSLIKNKVAEHKTIEYKSILKLTSDADRKEFLADVSSFANAAGGVLIFGIDEDQGIPKSISGIELQDVDAEKLKIEQIIATGISPRLPSIVIHPVKLTNGRYALVIRIGKSWISPHRVTFSSHDKFYSRNSAGKFPMDVGELRIAFNLSETLNEKIRRFREERISKIYTGEISELFEGRPKTVLHLIPLVSFSPGVAFDFLKIANKSGEMPPMNTSGCNSRINLDGFVTFSGDRQDASFSYTQLYRNGIIEAVETLCINRNSQDQEKLFIPSVSFEEDPIIALKAYLKILEDLGVELPILLFFSMLGVKKYKMYVKNLLLPEDAQAIDRDIILLPEEIIETYNVRSDRILKPCFDAIWNACGYDGSRHYDEEKNWNRSR
ncbi:MAG: ATP-binding protein [Candidatus Omnitrophota bacterium]